MSDDETVGTLPVVMDEPGIDPLSSLDRALSFVLRGSPALVSSAIVDATGNGYVEKRVLASGEIELTFNGDVEIVLDSFLMEHAGIELSAVYGWKHAGAPAAVIATDLAAPRPFKLAASRSLDLPLGRMVRGGLLDAGERVEIHAALRPTQRSVLGMRNDGSFFVLNQG
jgi:hypothetical protein